jgi:hypothetical protein
VRTSWRERTSTRGPNNAPAIHVTILQIPAWRTTAGLSARSGREGFVNRIPPNTPPTAAGSQIVRTTPATRTTAGWLELRYCVARLNLEVHYEDPRSKGGDDSEENLIALSTDCHSLVHHSFWLRKGPAKSVRAKPVSGIQTLDRIFSGAWRSAQLVSLFPDA